MPSIKSPTGIGPTQTPSSTPAKGAEPASQKPSLENIKIPGGIIDPKAVGEAIERYKKIRDRLRQPFFSGAAGLFAKNVVFPEELLDPKDPANDPKYLHLMCALFGLKELEKIFLTEDQRREKDEDEEQELTASAKVPARKKSVKSPKKK